VSSLHSFQAERAFDLVYQLRAAREERIDCARNNPMHISTPVQRILRFAIPSGYNLGTIFNHPANLRQEKGKVFVVFPIELVESRMVRIHEQDPLPGKAGRLCTDELHQFSKVRLEELIAQWKQTWARRNPYFASLFS
jgi:hypothetical protein